MTVNLRAAQESDFDGIASLLESSKLPVDGVQDCIFDFIVAEQDGKLVGSVAVERCGDFGLLRSAAVSESLRGQKLGATLVERALENAKEDGIDDVYLLTTTAEEYFPRFGFTRIARDEAPAELRAHEQFTSLCPDSAVVMRKTLRGY
jgi:amino-acid N-acetyltransferase